MIIISVAHQKGGVGKTTLALNLAYCLSKDLKVAITDTDLQGSISDISPFLKDIDLIPLSKIQNGTRLSYDIVIIDTPPYLTDKLQEIFLMSDFVLIPTKAGYLDALAVRGTIALFDQAKKKKPSLKAGVVLNMLTRTNLNDEVKEILDQYTLPILKTTINQRVSYARSPMTAGVFNSDDDKAKTEMVDLSMEIFSLLP
ncbi:cobyrinic acid a,c-diamide synthase [Dyadobacter endophyticus]|uniref:Cobyrinic acid a,c-diamide synthase n=1 Tax=Dyadobacter endophyticus TaxID=1749036 RepID=A0ABQ1ZCB5_9BACT|nr:ParA family protein [Dyadobacter endophyticus]GGH55840.1 cobyrinic acid a,c-diamide synthase [Dyadobacter endophyticus]